MPPRRSDTTARNMPPSSSATRTDHAVSEAGGARARTQWTCSTTNRRRRHPRSPQTTASAHSTMRSQTPIARRRRLRAFSSIPGTSRAGRVPSPLARKWRQRHPQPRVRSGRRRCHGITVVDAAARVTATATAAPPCGDGRSHPPSGRWHRGSAQPRGRSLVSLSATCVSGSAAFAEGHGCLAKGEERST